MVSISVTRFVMVEERALARAQASLKSPRPPNWHFEF